MNIFLIFLSTTLVYVNGASIIKEELLDFKQLTDDFEFFKSIPAEDLYEIARVAPQFKYLSLPVLKFLREVPDADLSKLLDAFTDLKYFTPAVFDVLQEVSEDTYETIFRAFPLLADYSPLLKEFFKEATEEDLEKFANSFTDFAAFTPETVKALKASSDEEIKEFIEENLPEASIYADDIISVIRETPIQVFNDLAKLAPNFKSVLYELAEYFKTLTDKFVEKFEAFKDFDAKELAKDVKNFISNADEELRTIAEGAKFVAKYTKDTFAFIKTVPLEMVGKAINAAYKLSKLSLQEIEEIQKNPELYKELFTPNKN